jgi:Ca-activated chloride channel family protein
VADWQLVLDGAFHLERPVLFWLLAGVALLLTFRGVRAGPHRVGVAAGMRRRSRRLPDLPWLLSLGVRGTALTLVGVALAGPVGLAKEAPSGGEGVDILIALDASGSMNALDAALKGRRVTRLELAKHVVADFVRSREGDRFGLVVFGEHAFTQCPLTVDRRLALETIERVRVGVAGDATALGEAIGLAVRRLQRGGASEGTRRVLLVLTDGRHNAGPLAPETAAQIASLSGIRIHTVGIGTTGSVPFARAGPGEPLRFERVDLDEETLRALARITGGRFFHARKPEDLASVAVAIDRLEVREHPAESRFRRVSLAPNALLAAVLLLLLETGTAHGLLRRLP